MPLSEVPNQQELPPAGEDPQAPRAAAVPEPARIRAGRYGEIDHTELVRLLDTIEDERSRGRFRESVYISLFVWIAIAWFALYGPRLLWHQRLISPVDVLKQRELTELIAPQLHAPAPIPHIESKLDNRTLEKMRRSEPPAPRPTPAPQPKPTPQPEPERPQPAPAQPVPTPRTAPAQPLPATPQPQPPAPAAAVPEAPKPQPATKPNFTAGGSAGDQVARAARESARGGYSGGGSSGRSGSGRSPVSMGGAEVLSDTEGVNFNPYLRRILDDIYRNWLPLIPEEARPPLNKQGETYVRFQIGPDGHILHMWLDGSTHDDAINRSCWGSITSEGQFPPLPSAFHGPNLELRIHYLVNHGNGDEAQ